MPKNVITFQGRAPSPEQFVKLRIECGWGEISLASARKSLVKSVVDLTCFDGNRLVGMGRVVGDGVLYFYLQDIIVRPDYQNQSIGREIVKKLMDDVRERADAGATIGLMSAKGKETFYQNFGFQERPTNSLGSGMTQFIL